MEKSHSSDSGNIFECLVVYVHNALNFDVIFPNNPDVHKLCVDESGQSITGKKCEIKRGNCETYEYSESETHISCRVRLAGIERVPPEDKKTLNPIDFILRRWVTMCSGVLLCQIHCIDKFGRMIADFYDPVVLTSISAWLVKEHPKAYRIHVKGSNSPKRRTSI